MRAEPATVPAGAQAGLRGTLQAQGYFLPCLCRPASDLDLASPEEASVFGRARVVAVQPLASGICRLLLEPSTSLYYHAGQFLNLQRSDGLTRSYSLASVPRVDSLVEHHVKRHSGGRMSAWICDELRAGEALDIQGPNGSCFYVPGRPEQPLLLVGTGTGLAPILGIARDALLAGHRGPVRLYHGSRAPSGSYLGAELESLAETYTNFAYHRCMSGPDVPAWSRGGRADAAAFADYPELAGWRVFLCGAPPMVHSGQKKAYLAGAALADILADAFELRELRHSPRT
jgi:ferredoxin-NADP reductase